MRRRQTGGAVVERKKCLVLAYADDLFLLAKTEDMKSIYVKMGLVLSALKSKIMIFKKGDKVKILDVEVGR